MIPINYPEPRFKNGTTRRSAVHVFDALRKKWLRLTEEEWVRQNFVHYLIAEMQYPTALIALEKGIGTEWAEKTLRRAGVRQRASAVDAGGMQSAAGGVGAKRCWNRCCATTSQSRFRISLLRMAQLPSAGKGTWGFEKHGSAAGVAAEQQIKNPPYGAGFTINLLEEV
jgi:hypothetical protein